MNKTPKIIYINLLILAIYFTVSMVFIYYGNQSKLHRGGYGGFAALVIYGTVLAVHSVGSIITGIVYLLSTNKENNAETGRSYILAGMLVALIGFSACSGVFYLGAIISE